MKTRILLLATLLILLLAACGTNGNIRAARPMPGGRLLR